MIAYYGKLPLDITSNFTINFDLMLIDYCFFSLFNTRNKFEITSKISFLILPYISNILPLR